MKLSSLYTPSVAGAKEERYAAVQRAVPGPVSSAVVPRCPQPPPRCLPGQQQRRDAQVKRNSRKDGGVMGQTVRAVALRSGDAALIEEVRGVLALADPPLVIHPPGAPRPGATLLLASAV